MKACLAIVASCALLSVCAIPASATFHVTQIEQVIGGVDGNTSVQAVQLRMNLFGQAQMQNARLMVRDAVGANPILLVDMTTAVANGAAGSRVLLATSNFSSFTNTPITPDYVLANTIPATYLAAGSLTFEDDFGTVYWRLSWGGAGYTGTGAGALTNDADGNFNPPFAGPLPSAAGKALLYQFGTTSSTNNDHDYLLTSGSATFTNNAGVSATIHSIVGVGEPTLSFSLGHPFPNPVHGLMTYAVTLPHGAHVRVDVLDAAGRRVTRLLDDAVPAGRNAFNWDPRTQSLRSGVYNLAMEADGVRVLRRFVYMRDDHAPSAYFGPHPE